MSFFEKKATQQDIERLIKETDDIKKSIRSLNDEFIKNIAESQKQLMAQEDILDLLENNNNKESLLEKHVSEIQEEKSQLLNLSVNTLDCLNTAIELLKVNAEVMQTEPSLKERGEKLVSQAAMLSETSSIVMADCGISIVGQIGEGIDYNKHQVVAVVEGNEKSQDSTIAKIYKPGYRYKNKLYRKAQVIAYKGR